MKENELECPTRRTMLKAGGAALITAAVAGLYPGNILAASSTGGQNMTTRMIPLEELSSIIDPVFRMRDTWYVVTARHEGRTNAMTAAWGALGNVWEKKTVTVYIRPQQFTKTLMDASGRFTLTFFDGHHDEMGYLGSHSGANIPDKIEQSGLHLIDVEGQPTYAEGKYVLICRTLLRQPIQPENFVVPNFAEETYPNKDYSVIFVAEIEAALELQR